MSSLPTPPAPAPEPNRIDNVSPSGDGRSSYWGLDAQETVAAYVKRCLLYTSLRGSEWEMAGAQNGFPPSSCC